MIALPKMNQLPYDLVIMGGLGYVCGHLANINAALSAVVLMTRSIANSVLFYIANPRVAEKLDISAEALYTGIDLVVTSAAIFTARKLDMISIKNVCMMMFVNFAVLAARLKLLHTTSPVAE